MSSSEVDTESIDALTQVQDEGLMELAMMRQLPLKKMRMEVGETVGKVELLLASIVCEGK
jgi:hypothetical protein